MKRLLITLSLLASVLPCPATEPGSIDHSRLLVYRDSSGTEHPVTTPADWANRRRQIVEGMQQAMGPLPDRANLPTLDMRVHSQADGDGFTRLSIDFAAEKKDRLPALLYRPKTRRLAKRPAILALHPTSPLGKHRVTKKGGVPNRAYAYELAKRAVLGR